MDERMPLVLLLTTVVVISRMFEDEEGIGIGARQKSLLLRIRPSTFLRLEPRRGFGRMRECVFVVSLNLPRT